MQNALDKKLTVALSSLSFVIIFLFKIRLMLRVVMTTSEFLLDLIYDHVRQDAFVHNFCSYLQILIFTKIIVKINVISFDLRHNDKNLVLCIEHAHET